MMMPRLTSAALLGFVMSLCSLSSTAQAADEPDPLALFPEEVGVVARVAAPQKTITKVARYAAKIEPQAAFVIPLVAPDLVGSMVRVPNMTGVDKQSDMWFGMVFKGQEEPAVIFAVKSTDVEAMKDSMFGDFTFVQQGDWVVYTEDPDAAKLLGDMKADSKGMAGKMADSSRKLFEQADASLYINIPALRTEYDAEIDMGREEMQNLLDEVPAVPDSGVDMQAVGRLWQAAVNNMFQGLEDAEGLVVTARIDGDNLIFEDWFLAAENTPTTRFFDRHPTSEMSTLGKLVPGQQVYYGAHVDFTSLMKSFAPYVTDLVPAEDEATRERMKAMFNELTEIEYGEYSGTMSIGPLDGGAFKSTSLMEATPGEKVKALSRKYAKEMAQGQEGVEVELKEEAESYGDLKVDVTTTRYSLDPAQDPLGMQKIVMESMFGGDAMIARSLVMKDKTLQTFGGGRDLMEKAIKAAGSDGKASSAMQETRNVLSKKANAVVLIDLANMAQSIASAFAESDQQFMPLSVDQVQSVDLPESFSGMSAAMEGNGLRLKFVVPAKQVKNIVDLVKALQTAAQPPEI